ncbi:putative Late nodulin [Medicago truncatula]|uniref:Nodule Cysteine-Rich (NCR) secreted peptide n=1 Tax=Medicago truncatula TaxID=3880 RepID=A0A072VJ77_MEDTR|nr:Nodule Cysteine-Rich (NCR) secreted peptide [Medicago truncatula]RHN79615.1 putative Late nodulin [Medicago truncatula]
MDKTIKFVYAMILFISMFLAARNVDAYLKCKTVHDCPKSQVVYRCVGNYCRAVKIRRWNLG